MFELERCLPEEAGIPSKAITAMLDSLEKNEVPIHSVLIARHGKLAAEAYYKPFGKDIMHRMYSVTKSFTSLAIGLLEQDGKIKLADRICQYFPEYLPGNVHPWLEAVTIEDMLQMKTCHNMTTYNKVSTTENWVKSFFQTPPAHRPGTIFMYDTSSSHTLCALIEKLTGQDLLSFLKERVLDKIGFSKESYIIQDPFGTSIGGSGLMAYSEDLLKTGLLLLNYGKDLEHYGTGDGEQLYPEDYIRRAVSFHGAPVMNRSFKDGYGYQFWLLPYGGFACLGMGDQQLLCYPQQDLAVVITADTQGMKGGSAIIHRVLYDELFPYLSDDRLEVCREDRETLEKRLAQLTVPVLEPGVKVSVDQINGHRYSLDRNPADFKEMGVTFRDDSGVLEYILNGKECCLPFGFGKLEEAVFPGYDQRCVSSGSWLDENTLYVLCWLVDESTASVQFKLCFKDSQLTVQMMKTEETKFLEYQGFLNS